MFIVKLLGKTQSSGSKLFCLSNQSMFCFGRNLTILFQYSLPKYQPTVISLSGSEEEYKQGWSEADIYSTRESSEDMQWE